MKRIFILFIIILNSCSTDEVAQTTPQAEPTCYQILARGYDERGHYIIVKISNFNNKRYQVTNYQDWLNKFKICEPITLTQQQL
jgi:hypothetical protein